MEEEALQQVNSSTNETGDKVNKTKSRKIVWIPIYFLIVIITLVLGFWLSIFTFIPLEEIFEENTGAGFFTIFWIYIIQIPLYIFIGLLIARFLQTRRLTKRLKISLLFIAIMYLLTIIFEIIIIMGE